MHQIEEEQIERLNRAIVQMFEYDFSNYAMSSYVRRLERIMQLYGFSDINMLISKLGQVTKQSDEEYMVKALRRCWNNLNFRNLLSKVKPDEGWEDFLTQFY